VRRPKVKVGKVLFTREQIQERLDRLADEIERRCAGKELTIVAVLKGSLIFTADLVRRLSMPVRMDILEVASYFDGTRPAEQTSLSSYMVDNIRGRHVLVVDDIVDTGRTLKRVLELLEREKPKSLATCVFLDKTGRREVDVAVDFRGFTLDGGEFVVGYGLDYAQRFRNLPHLAALEKTAAAKRKPAPKKKPAASRRPVRALKRRKK
jgi:hypoxanthine phosphoribosyltransferase